MFKKCVIIVCFIIGFSSLSFPQETKFTKREKNEVREGPGNYYVLNFILPRDMPLQIIKVSGSWLRFDLDYDKIPEQVEIDFTGSETWISKNCLIEKAAKTDYSNLNLEWKTTKASKSSVAAAVRGRALRFGQASPESLESLINWQTDLFTTAEYMRFLAETRVLLGSSSSRNYFALYPAYFVEYDISLNEAGIGLGLTSRILADNILPDLDLLKYVNLITTFLSESTGAYDQKFLTVILKDEGLKAYSIPGGYIVISKGMLDLCTDESELAALITTEMMHVILQHGWRKMMDRPVNRRVDLAMQELERETGVRPDSSELELEEYARQAYDNINKPRTLQYEAEADRGAVLLLAQTGYDPQAVPRLILKIRQGIRENEDLEMENPFARLDYTERYTRINRFMSTALAGKGGARNRDRFLREMRD